MPKKNKKKGKGGKGKGKGKGNSAVTNPSSNALSVSTTEPSKRTQYPLPPANRRLLKIEGVTLTDEEYRTELLHHTDGNLLEIHPCRVFKSMPKQDPNQNPGQADVPQGASTVAAVTAPVTSDPQGSSVVDFSGPFRDWFSGSVFGGGMDWVGGAGVGGEACIVRSIDTWWPRMPVGAGRLPGTHMGLAFLKLPSVLQARMLVMRAAVLVRDSTVERKYRTELEDAVAKALDKAAKVWTKDPLVLVYALCVLVEYDRSVAESDDTRSTERCRDYLLEALSPPVAKLLPKAIRAQILLAAGLFNYASNRPTKRQYFDEALRIDSNERGDPFMVNVGFAMKMKGGATKNRDILASILKSGNDGISELERGFKLADNFMYLF